MKPTNSIYTGLPTTIFEEMSRLALARYIRPRFRAMARTQSPPWTATAAIATPTPLIAAETAWGVR